MGFALETEDLLQNALTKMERKGFDLVVANPANESDAGFDSETNRVLLVEVGKDPQEIPVLPKEEVAELILDQVAPLVGEGE